MTSNCLVKRGATTSWERAEGYDERVCLPMVKERDGGESEQRLHVSASASAFKNGIGISLETRLACAYPYVSIKRARVRGQASARQGYPYPLDSPESALDATLYYGSRTAETRPKLD